MCLHDLDSVFHMLRAAGSGEALGTKTGFKSAALERTTFFVKRNSDMDTREGKKYSKKEGGERKEKKGMLTTNCQQRV